jgi:hypothetical protein
VGTRDDRREVLAVETPEYEATETQESTAVTFDVAESDQELLEEYSVLVAAEYNYTL